MNKIMFYQSRMPTPEEVAEIILQGFKKINARLVNPWLERRVRSKSLSVRRRWTGNEE
jgi:hypothetical protein